MGELSDSGEPYGASAKSEHSGGFAKDQRLLGVASDPHCLATCRMHHIDTAYSGSAGRSAESGREAAEIVRPAIDGSG